jgi:hypothetical protein
LDGAPLLQDSMRTPPLPRLGWSQQSPRLPGPAKSQDDGSVPLMRTKCSPPSMHSIFTCTRCSHLGESVGGSVPVLARFDRRWSLPAGKLHHQAGEELCAGRIEEAELHPPSSSSSPNTQIQDVCTHRHFATRWLAFRACSRSLQACAFSLKACFVSHFTASSRPCVRP